MSKTKFRVLNNDESTFEFVPNGYAYLTKGKVATQGWVTIRNGGESLSLETDDVPAFIEALNRAAAKTEAMKAKEEVNLTKVLEARQQKDAE